jgi:hypothetical protein
VFYKVELFSIPLGGGNKIRLHENSWHLKSRPNHEPHGEENQLESPNSYYPAGIPGMKAALHAGRKRNTPTVSFPTHDETTNIDEEESHKLLGDSLRLQGNLALATRIAQSDLPSDA